MDYHDRPEWSYSQMKVILDHGIDYAVAEKRKMLPPPKSQSIDLGQLVHMIILGGKDCYALKEDSGYEKFLSKEAKAWRDQKIAEGKTIITKAEFAAVDQIVKNIEAHSFSQKWLKADGHEYETEMYATVNSVPLRGKADIVIKKENSLIVSDIKTTSKFDQWVKNKYFAMNMHYDLQAALYSLIAGKAFGMGEGFINFYFCVAETVAPYRVQWHHAGLEFLEHGQAKLANCLEEIKKFGDQEPNFLIEEVNELGDFSL